MKKKKRQASQKSTKERDFPLSLSLSRSRHGPSSRQRPPPRLPRRRRRLRASGAPRHRAEARRRASDVRQLFGALLGRAAAESGCGGERPALVPGHELPPDRPGVRKGGFGAWNEGQEGAMECKNESRKSGETGGTEEVEKRGRQIRWALFFDVKNDDRKNSTSTTSSSSPRPLNHQTPPPPTAS